MVHGLQQCGQLQRQVPCGEEWPERFVLPKMRERVQAVEHAAAGSSASLLRTSAKHARVQKWNDSLIKQCIQSTLRLTQFGQANGHVLFLLC